MFLTLKGSVCTQKFILFLCLYLWSRFITQTALLLQPWADERAQSRNCIFKHLIQFMEVSFKVWPWTCLPREWICGFLRIHEMQLDLELSLWASLWRHLVFKSPSVSTLQAMLGHPVCPSLYLCELQRIPQQQWEKTGPAKMGCVFIYRVGVHVPSWFRLDNLLSL